MSTPYGPIGMAERLTEVAQVCDRLGLHVASFEVRSYGKHEVDVHLYSERDVDTLAAEYDMMPDGGEHPTVYSRRARERAVSAFSGRAVSV